MVSPNQYIFTAGIIEGSSKIEVTFDTSIGNCEEICDSPLELEITFNVIRPNGLSFRNTTFSLGSTYCGSLIHVENRPSTGFAADVFILPDNVNFYNVTTSEGHASPMASGPYFTAFTAAGFSLPDHPPNAHVGNTNTVTAGLGTKTSRVDQIWLGLPCVPPVGSVPGNLDGLFVWEIPWNFALSSDQNVVIPMFATSTYTATNTGSSLVFRGSKGAGQSSHHLTDPSTICSFSPPCN